MSKNLKQKRLDAGDGRLNVRIGLRDGVRPALAVLLVLTVVLCVLPLGGLLPDGSLDSSWAWVMNEAVARHLVIGRDIVFTFGPLASVYTRQYDPPTDAIAMAGSLLIGIALSLGLLSLSMGRRKWPLIAIPLAILVLYLRDPLFIVLPPVLLMLTARIEMAADAPLHLRRTWLTTIAQITLVASLGVLPLIKGTFGALSIASGVLCLLLQFRSSPARAFGGIGVYVGTLIVGWLVTAQPLAALPDYFLSMRPIIAAYTDAMSIRGPDRELCIFGVSALALMSALGWTLRRNMGMPEWVLMAGIALTLFIAFKAGFVRHDIHALIAMGTLTFLEIIVALTSPGLVAALLVVLAIGGYGFVDNAYFKLQTLPARLSSSVMDIVAGAKDRVTDASFPRLRYEQRTAEMRAALPLPPLKGTWDVYSYAQHILLANGVSWSPRPVFQSYAAFDPKLAALNAAHLKGASAPDNILFSIFTIDYHLPALEDGLSWPTLLNDYAIEGRQDSYLILRKHANAPPPRFTPLKEIDVVAGESVPVPASDTPVWVKIDMKPSLVGRIASTLYAIPEVEIELSLFNGTKARYRYIPSAGAAGFVISPLVRDTAEFALLMSGRTRDALAGLRPTSFRILPQRNSSVAWSKSVRVQFSTLDLPGQR